VTDPTKTGNAATCIGFGPHEGTCENPAGSSHSKLWCQRCDDLRLAHLDEQFKKIGARFAQEATR
jgi:hypothetical protein